MFVTPKTGLRTLLLPVAGPRVFAAWQLRRHTS
jgi:hypothetical protein